jgi:dTDP-4-amino-4,6-dideoxygalactose transaminase
MRDKFLVFGAPRIEREEIDEVIQVLESGWLGTGPRVHKFEADIAAYKGVDPDRVVAVNSCTAALHLSFVAAGFGPADEVITTPMTFCATVNAIIHAGARPVLADIDPATLNIDPAAIEAAITPRTRAIVPVHFAGRPCDMHAVRRIADRHGLMIIEDCAHAIETLHDDRHAGTLGDFGCFSFYVTKNVVTGEGGLVLAKTAEQASRVKVLSLHGMNKDAWKRFGSDGYRHYQVTECGFKYNMTDLQAAIGIHQLRRVGENLRRRNAIWAAYDQAFDGLPLGLPAPQAPDGLHARHLYTVMVDTARAGITRDRFLAVVSERRIGVGVHYMSVPEHPYYQEKLGWRPERYPNAMRVGRQTVSLPLSPAMTDQDVADTIEAVRAALNA